MIRILIRICTGISISICMCICVCTIRTKRNIYTIPYISDDMGMGMGMDGMIGKDVLVFEFYLHIPEYYMLLYMYMECCNTLLYSTHTLLARR